MNTGRFSWSGRSVVLCVLAVYALALTGAAHRVGRQQAWHFAGVPALSPPFADLHNVTSGVDCARQGIDPLRSDPCDPLRRPMNYPRLWVTIPRLLGVRQTDTLRLGVGLLVLAAGAAWLLAGPLTAKEGLVFALMLCSPAVMLGVERGNNDLFIFALLCVAGAGLTRGPSVRGFSYLLIEACAWLKLYPIAAAWSVLREEPKRAGWMGVVLITLFALYLALTWRDVQIIFSTVPHFAYLSYGHTVVFDRVGVAGWARVALLLTVLGTLVLAVRWQKIVPSSAETSPLFLMGAALYVATFAAGSSWDYRLVMVMLAVPQMLVWQRSRRLRPLAWGLLMAVLAALWLSPLSEHLKVFVIRQAACWTLFAMLLGILAVQALQKMPALHKWKMHK